MLILIYQATPLYIIRSGLFGWPTESDYGVQADRGYLWSGTTWSDAVGYHLRYGSGVISPAYGSIRGTGFPVRCIAAKNHVINMINRVKNIYEDFISMLQ